MFMIYDLIYLILAIFYLPLRFFKGKGLGGISERLGIYPPEFIQQVKNKKTIWVHAVSVGEILSSAPLLNSIKKEFPQYKLVVSTTTAAGYSMAKKILGVQDLLIYFPFDLSIIVKRAVEILNPVLFILMEKEFWPNLINRLNKNNVPVVVINGRLSSKSLAKYRKVKFLLPGIFTKISLFCMQSKTDASRVAELGINQDKIKITGNLKFDASATAEIPREIQEKYRESLVSNKSLLLAGSTHRGEEEILIKIYSQLRLEEKGWILLIAPRHLERVEEVEQAAAKYGFNGLRISNLTSSPKRDSIIYILDTMGELKTFYSLSDLVFVGGSLIPFGGHNLIEPAYFSKPIIFGKHIFNFQEIADEFVARGAGIMVNSLQELKETIALLASDRKKREEIGLKGKNVVNANLGATQRNIQEIKKIIRA